MNEQLLKKTMRAHGVSQEELAERIGMDRSTLNRKINGWRKGFFVGEVKAVGEALGLSRGELMDVFFNDYRSL